MRMLVLIVSAILTLCVAGPLQARQVNVPSGNPIVGLDIPSDWTTSPSERGIEVKSPDEEVFFWLEVYLPADRDTVAREHESYFAEEGVKTVGEARISRFEEGAVKVQATDLPATWNGKPTILRYLAVDAGLPAGNTILLSYWASPEGDKTYDAAFRRILKSLGAPK